MSRAILLNKRRKKKKPILLPQNTFGEALADQYNGDLDLLDTTDAYRLRNGKTGTAGYIDSLMPPALETPVEQSAPALKLMDESEASSILQNPNSTEESILNARKYFSGNFEVPSESNTPLMDEQTATGILQNPNADPTELNAAREYFSGGALSDPVGSGRGEYGMPEQNYVPDQEMPTGARLDPYMNIPRINNDAQDETFDADAVLINRKEPVSNKGKAVLDTTSSNDRKGSAVSSNARGSMMPFAKINRNEALMRIGGAIVGGSSQGFSGAMKAATDEFGNIQDANRKAETDAFNKAEATRLAEERIAALKAKADAKNVKTPNTAAMQYGMAALNAIDRIEALVNAEQKWVPWDNTTGLIGNLMKSVPASAANDVLANIKTIEAAVGFDRLQAMRDASPTGGALGQVSNIELDLLKSSLGNLNQSQSKEQFMMNLKQVQRVYNEIVHTDIHSPNRKTTVETDTNNDLSDDEKKYLGL